MALTLGDPRQVGYVVSDIEVAMKHWHTRMNIGPWFYKEDIGVTEFSYYGQPVDVLPKVSIAIANSGHTQIELIQLRNDTPSAWSDSLRVNGDGPQHIAYWTEQYDDVHAELIAAGLTEAHQGRCGNRGRFSYFVHADVPGSVIELSEYTGGKRAYFESIAEAARNWDGTDPVRVQSA
ncbi:MAG TPA: VOC family protein [Aldersonia sp.]